MLALRYKHILMGAVFLSAAPMVLADSWENRLIRLERQLQSSGQLQADTQYRLDALQQELRDLRGIIEAQGHQIKQLVQRQRDMYRDIEQRLAQPSSSPTQVSAPQNADQPQSSTVAAADNSASELDDLDSAFKLVRAKEYSKAVAAYQQFLQQYPRSQYAVNAHYWLGQIYYVQQELAKAQNAFETVTKQFPQSKKMPDALLKLGMIAVDGNDKKAAKRYFDQVIQQYASSSAAQLAKSRLREL